MASSLQHKELTTRCRAWLHRRTTGRGMRSGFEVPLADGYVADWVCLCGMQNRYERQYLGSRQLERRNGVVFRTEFACVFETKVTGSDFNSTFGRTTIAQRGRGDLIGSLHWVVTPRNVSAPGLSVLPPHWGLLVDAGRGLREVRSPVFNPVELHALFEIAYRILWYGKNVPG